MPIAGVRRVRTPSVGKFRAPPFAGVQRVHAVSNAVSGGLRHKPTEIEDSPEPEEWPVLAAGREKAEGREREEATHTVREKPGSRTMREASLSRTTGDDLASKLEPASRLSACEHMLVPVQEDAVRAPVQDEPISTSARDAGLAWEQVPPPVIGSRFTDTAVRQCRPPKIGTCGVLGLEVAPDPPSARGFDATPIAPSARTFDAVGRTLDGTKAFGGPVRSFDGPGEKRFLTPSTRYDPARFDAVSPVTSRFDTVRRDIPTPPGPARYDTSPVVSRFGTSPARFEHDPTPVSYVPLPIPRHDLSRTTSGYDPTRIRAPEPHTDTETDKDVDAPGSPLSEDETADEADRMDVEVVHGKVAETSSHPFPFS
ncbi:SET domain and PHD finger protein [Ceratobasidium sp. AG-Ba]|nr:SET domain and PHD finger protein [Ceratobasidium sp. AG-Ba]QRW09644.1 hypothetical protein RhiLY_08643 [Ceratobasidium sp. AG-Ba]